MKYKVENYLRDLFPILIDLDIKEIDDEYFCKFSHYVSDNYGNPISKTINIKVKLVDGFLKIVD